MTRMSLDELAQAAGIHKGGFLEELQGAAQAPCMKTIYPELCAESLVC